MSTSSEFDLPKKENWGSKIGVIAAVAEQKNLFAGSEMRTVSLSLCPACFVRSVRDRRDKLPVADTLDGELHIARRGAFDFRRRVSEQPLVYLGR